MKFVFITDTHIKEKNPINRLDNYFETVINKIDEAARFAVENNVNFIVHGGDLFDTPTVSTICLVKFNRILFYLKENNIKFYVVSGNHDIYGRNPDTLPRTHLGLLESFGAIEMLDRENTIEEKFSNGNSVKIIGTPYIYKMDAEDKEAYLLSEYDKKDGEFLINVVHGMLLEKPFIKEIEHTVVTDIINTKADLTLSGHYHTGFGIISLNDRIFLNPGSLTRCSNTTEEYKRMPQYALIEINDDLKPDIKLIDVKCAKPGYEVLDREYIEKHKNDKLEVLNFENSIKEAADFDKYDYYSVLEEIIESDNVEKEVIDEAKKRLEKAEEDIHGQD